MAIRKLFIQLLIGNPYSAEKKIPTSEVQSTFFFFVEILHRLSQPSQPLVFGGVFGGFWRFHSLESTMLPLFFLVLCGCQPKNNGVFPPNHPILIGFSMK